MEDNKFDKLMKEKISNEENIPEEINKIFSNFEKEIRMEKSNRMINLGYIFRYVTIFTLLILVVGVGGSTYAHINGKETLISPLLRDLGINPRYEENTVLINKEVEDQNITVQMVDVAIDNTNIIVGYKINVPENKNFIQIEGSNRVNGMYIAPINKAIKKVEENEYLYYQIFDINEIELENNEKITFNSNIYRISEYTEYESNYETYEEAVRIFEGNWTFEEVLEINNVVENKIYEFEEAPSVEIKENVNLSVTELVVGSYTNILKIKTDKTNYVGDDFKKYYRILDENNHELAVVSEEEKMYDETIYNDRITLEKLSLDSKVKIEIYVKEYHKPYEKAATLDVDLSKFEEKKEVPTEYNYYEDENYKFKYNKEWTVISEKEEWIDIRTSGIYTRIEVPSTTNSEYPSYIMIELIDEPYTLEEYIDKSNKDLNISVSESYDKIDEGSYEISNTNGYQITSTTAAGEVYVLKEFFTVKNNKVYDISFFTEEKDYNNIKEEIEEFVQNFEIID